ncbi:MAG: DUF86 domain-containing protein [Candidatus Solibacter sp.]|nr:DUF86 domain-containing protein [Candidatus Solibacter sp.]
MRRDSLYLTDIVEAADHIAAFIVETDFPAFQKSELLRSAVVQKLAIIGEAAARVSEELKAHHSQVPWPKIIAFRNILVHAYFGIDSDVVWLATRNPYPILREQVAGILAAESGGTEDRSGR